VNTCAIQKETGLYKSRTQIFFPAHQKQSFLLQNNSIFTAKKQLFTLSQVLAHFLGGMLLS
jgi:hypothetical protein